MTSQFINRGGFFTVADSASLDVRLRLPADTYTLGFDTDIGFMIQVVQKVAENPKVYGNLFRFRDRIMTTFEKRPSNTGVLLEGLKGSGKTMLARMISLIGLEKDIPTLIINTPFKGDGFNKFMQSINQPIIVLFDEFEKVYDEEDQEAILTLLDGVYTSKKLFVLTCNDAWRIDQNMKNRPGRLFYRIKFKGLERDAILQYCEENLENKAHIDSVLNVSGVFDEFNFDMLKALVEEMNRYNEPAANSLQMLNMYPDGGNDTYECVANYKGDDIPGEDLQIISGHGNPLTVDMVDVHVRLPDGEHISAVGRSARQPKNIASIPSLQDLSTGIHLDLEPKDPNAPPPRKWSRFKFQTNAPVSVKNGILVFKGGEDIFFRFTRKVEKTFNFDAI